MRHLALAGAALLTASWALASGASAAQVAGAASEAPASANPLLQPWTGPNGGVPPFDKVRVADFQPALDAAMAEHLREVARIADNPAPPTFDNTILALERTGLTLDRVRTIYGVWDGNRSSPELRAVSKIMAPKLAAHGDAVTQNARLFARIDAVYAARAKLDPVQQRLTWVYWNRFVRAGAKLNAEQKAQLSRYNQELAGLYNTFGANELSDEETYALVLDSAAQLKGLPASEVAAAAAEAQRRGQPGKWVIANTRSSMEPFLTYADDRALREKGWRMWTLRGDNGDAHDNNATVVRILQVRAAKAKLLGYPTFAHYRLADAMAKTPDAAMSLMMAVWEPAKAAVRRDVADMQVIADTQAKSEGHAAQKIEAWDYRYYAEKLRKAKYDLDLNEIKPYLQLDHVRDAMFMAANKVYGFEFKPVTGFAVFDPAMSVYEVTRDGRHVGYWYFDPYARPGKRSGAWMNAYQPQHRLDGGQPTIVSNNANFVQGAPGQPVLIGWDDARTMFHEFGHAIHGLNSDVTYPTLSGTAVQRDYVEFPSQLNEHFLTTPEVLRYLVNERGERIPDALVAKIQKAHTFNQGFATVEAQESALIDMKLHLAGDAAIEPHAFEKASLAELGAPPEIVMRHRIPQFGHVFQGEGYAAGYYGYLWAEVLDQDAWEAFQEAGNSYDPATAKRLRADIMSVGNTVEPAQQFRNFRGRDPKVDALLRDRGFPVPATRTAQATPPPATSAVR